MRYAAALSIAIAACCLTAAETPPYITHGPMLGHVGAAEARVWIRVSKPTSAVLTLWNSAAEAQVMPAVKIDDATALMAHLTATGLKPGASYTYQIALDGTPALTSPLPTFTCAPENGTKSKFRFAFISCLGRNNFECAAAWGDMDARVKTDFLLMIGDNTYADSTDPAVQSKHYLSHRDLPGFRSHTRRTPTYAIWDDHDFGPNDSDGTAAGKERSIENFSRFWANPSYGEADNPGCYFKFSRGDVDFFMLDGRYYRTPNGEKDEGAKTMLGPKQMAWLQRELKASTARVKFMAMGSEWQMFGTKDSWNSFARERGELFKFIEDNKIGGVVLLSGDRHFTGGYQVQGRFIEITSGPFGSKNFPRKEPYPEMFFHEGAGKLYAIFDVDTTGENPALKLEVYRVGEGMVVNRTFTWQEITGETKIPPLTKFATPAP